MWPRLTYRLLKGIVQDEVRQPIGQKSAHRVDPDGSYCHKLCMSGVIYHCYLLVDATLS
jgi:hypothetical protein